MGPLISVELRILYPEPVVKTLAPPPDVLQPTPLLRVAARTDSGAAAWDVALDARCAQPLPGVLHLFIVVDEGESRKDVTNEWGRSKEQCPKKELVCDDLMESCSAGLMP